MKHLSALNASFLHLETPEMPMRSACAPAAAVPKAPVKRKARVAAVP